MVPVIQSPSSKSSPFKSKSKSSPSPQEIGLESDLSPSPGLESYNSAKFVMVTHIGRGVFYTMSATPLHFYKCVVRFVGDKLTFLLHVTCYTKSWTKLNCQSATLNCCNPFHLTPASALGVRVYQDSHSHHTSLLRDLPTIADHIMHCWTSVRLSLSYA